MPLVINDSPNVSALDSSVIIDLCTGAFFIDVVPTVWVGTGYNNVLGVNVIVKNEDTGIVIKDYPDIGYDIETPFDGNVSVPIPTRAGSYQYGKYSFKVVLYDAGGKVYEYEKQYNVCSPANSNGGKSGKIDASFEAKCKDGKVVVIVDAPPTYGGVISDSQVNDFSLSYPTVSGTAPLASTVRNFSARLWEGVYDISGNTCAHYTLKDNFSAKVKYTLSCEKNILCGINPSCVYERLIELHKDIDAGCSSKEKEDIQARVTRALLNLQIVQSLTEAGEDASDYIQELEDALGCKCSCGDSASPVSGTPSGDVIIEGCGIESETVGNTTTYTINNYEYKLVVSDNGGVFTASSYSVDGCTKIQTLTYNVSRAYQQIKAQVNKQTEWDFWANVWKQSINGIDAACLGLTQEQFISLSAKDVVQKIIELGCKGGNCDGVINNATTSVIGGDVVISWEYEPDTGVYEVAVYVDGTLTGTVLSGEESFTAVDFADGKNHTYNIVSKCANGSIGVSIQGTFKYSGCPTIATPIVSSNNVIKDCPYSLDELIISTPPNGITYEWHTSNNTSNETTYGTPESASAGVYYLFAKTGDGCFSTGLKVTLSCTETALCTAPQSPSASAVGNGVLISFASASNPPSGNVYTVLRRRQSDPDVAGSYTTIGSALWNASTNKWQVTDTTRTQNVMYVYRIQSECSSSKPYVDLSFADISCPSVQLVSVSEPLTVLLGRTSGTLNANIQGGTPPYSYTFDIRKVSGDCEGHTIDAPSGTSSLNNVSTGYTVTYYGGTVYGFKVTVTDSALNTIESDELTLIACLVPETLITTINGVKKPLELIKVGEMLSVDNYVTSWEEKYVPELFVINDGALKCSGSHVHILSNKDLIETEFLSVGDKLISEEGKGIDVVKIEKISGRFRVINISTTNQTYVANGILTHNKLQCP